MKKFYLIEAATALAVHVSDTVPTLTEESAIFDNETFLCFNENNSFILEAEEVADFAQFKYRAVGNNLVLNLDWVAPSIDLTALKTAKNLEINQWRADANLTTFPHAGKLIACDALSRSDIEGVAGNISLMGAFPAGFPNGWKAVDNDYVPLPTIESFKDMYASMTLQGTLNFARSQELKLELSEAQTPEAIAAIKW